MKINSQTSRSLATGLTLGVLIGGATLAHAAPVTPEPGSPAAITQQHSAFAALAKQLKPAVVNIAVEKTVTEKANIPGMLGQFFDEQGVQMAPREQVERGEGSGVIISNDGFIVTNNHVVSNARRVRVNLSDGRELSAKVIGTDPKTDLALVKVDATNLPYASLGNSDELEVGDWVMAIGNPFGLHQTVTVGVLSGKGRELGEGPYDDFLQTDASINPGNSGGPLFNTEGKVIGINTAIIKGGQGIGFAIPASVVQNIIPELKSTGHVTRGYLGVAVQPLEPELRSALGLPDGAEGALVAQVMPDSPAGQAGIKVEDVVTAINGNAVHSDRELRARTASLPVGHTAQVTVLHQGKSETLPVRIAQMPDGAARQLPVRQHPETHQRSLGIELAPLSPDVAQELHTSDTHGVVVADVVQNSAAEAAGLERGDIIRAVDTRRFTTLREFVQLVQNAKRTSGIALLVERNGQSHFVVIDPNQS